jgi:hypothetical protein
MTKTKTKTKKTTSDEPEVEWGEYPRIEPGDYPAYCLRAKWYWDHYYRRWTCLLVFDALAANLVDSLGEVPVWFNGGNDETHPKAPRRGNYFVAWLAANGRKPPRRDRLAPKVFTKRMAQVRVGDTVGPCPYSVVKKILSWKTGSESPSFSL